MDELTIHRKEIERLDDVYTNYNQFLLYQVSENVLATKKEHDKNKQIVEETEQDLANFKENSRQTTAEVEDAEEKL